MQYFKSEAMSVAEYKRSEKGLSPESINRAAVVRARIEDFYANLINEAADREERFF